MLKNISTRFNATKTRAILRRCASQDIVQASSKQVEAQAGHTLPSVYSLSNDLRVACFNNDSEIGATAIHVEAGTRNETAEVNGVSNFIARLAGRGTASTKLEELQMKLSKMAANLDVTVNREYTSFVVTGFSKDSLEHADILSEVVKHSVFDEAAIAKERENILMDIDKQRENIPEIVMNYLYSMAYEGTPMSQSLTGTSKTIESLTRKDILSFIDNNYKAPRMLLTSVGGQVDLDQLAEAAQKKLGDVSTKYPNGAAYPKPCRFTAMEMQHRDDDKPLAHVAMGFNGCAYSSKDKLPLMLLTEMFGTHDKSYGGLGQALNRIGKATENPDAGMYTARSFAHFYSDCGLFGIYYVADPDSLQDAGHFLSRYLRDQSLCMSESNLVRAKRLLRKRLVENMYNLPAVQDKLALDIFFGEGRPEPLEETVAKIESLTREQVQDTVYDYINDMEFVRAAYGATEAVFDYQQNMDALRGFRW